MKTIMPYVVTLDDDFDDALSRDRVHYNGVLHMGHGGWAGYGGFSRGAIRATRNPWQTDGRGYGGYGTGNDDAHSWSQWDPSEGWMYRAKER